MSVSALIDINSDVKFDLELLKQNNDRDSILTIPEAQHLAIPDLNFPEPQRTSPTVVRSFDFAEVTTNLSTHQDAEKQARAQEQAGKKAIAEQISFFEKSRKEWLSKLAQSISDNEKAVKLIAAEIGQLQAQILFIQNEMASEAKVISKEMAIADNDVKRRRATLHNEFQEAETNVRTQKLQTLAIQTEIADLKKQKQAIVAIVYDASLDEKLQQLKKDKLIKQREITDLDSRQVSINTETQKTSTKIVGVRNEWNQHTSQLGS